MIVTGHTPNLLPGVSVTSKIAAADVFICMNMMQYERHGYCNRNRFTGGSWFTVPVAEADVRAEFRHVRMADPSGRAREKVARTLEARLGSGAYWYAYHLRSDWPGKRLVDVTLPCLAELLADLRIDTAWAWQSRLVAGRYDNVSEGLAAMVAEVGGTTWLSGPSGRRYLDETPFHARGIDVRYHEHDGPNPTALELLIRPKAVAA